MRDRLGRLRRLDLKKNKNKIGRSFGPRIRVCRFTCTSISSETHILEDHSPVHIVRDKQKPIMTSSNGILYGN
ncbi:hypothetical protein Hanom_Chr12g01144981 [Helianthus anomalus]